MQSVKLTVIQKLIDIYGPDVYTNDNVLLSGTHTHSGPGGFSWYNLYDMTTLGFSKGNFDTIVDGIVQAIVRAHNDIATQKPGARLLLNSGKLYESNINRSPNAYLNNPAEERALYPDGNTDKTMVVARLEDADAGELGLISWFAVHCTSMNNTNTLISGDNKGYASYYIEQIKNNHSLPGDVKFLAAFGQSNEGDVSPNTLGPMCPDGTSCDNPTSTCHGQIKTCNARGPGWPSDFKSAQIIGTNQAQMAMQLYDAASADGTGPVDYRHMHLNMTDQVVADEFGGGHTCRAAMGYSFAAGTTDGPGEFDFRQSDNSTSNPFWNFLTQFIAKPTKEQIDCQAPKPILIDVGETHPYPWVPDVLPVQIIRVGKLVILGVPGEFTTMSGRRLRNTVSKVLSSYDPYYNDAIVVIAGLSNAYSGYITTPEEYEVQRYEGASTIFGPHTLPAYQQAFATMAQALATGKSVEPGPMPRNLSDHQLNFNPGVIFDDGPFGQLVQDVEQSYHRGDLVTAIFHSAHPKNNYMIEASFLTVEQYTNGNWTVRFDDGNWETKFSWKRVGVAGSHATITWEIPDWTEPGQYRIRHFGYHKSVLGKIAPFEGSSSTFTVA